MINLPIMQGIEFLSEKFLCDKDVDIMSTEQKLAFQNFYNHINDLRQQGASILKSVLKDLEDDNISSKTKENIAWIRKNGCYLEGSDELEALHGILKFDISQRNHILRLYNRAEYLAQDNFKEVLTCNKVRSISMLIISVMCSVMDLLLVNGPVCGMLIGFPLMAMFFSALFSLTMFSNTTIKHDTDLINQYGFDQKGYEVSSVSVFNDNMLNCIMA